MMRFDKMKNEVNWYRLDFQEPAPILETGSLEGDDRFSLNVIDPVDDGWIFTDLRMCAPDGSNSIEFRDYMFTNAFAPVFSPSSVNHLGEFFSADGVMCDVSIDGQSGYKYFRCSNNRDVLDMENSDFAPNPFVQGQILRLDRIVFVGSKLSGDILRLPQRERMHELFVSDRFRQVVEKARLSGFVFTPIEVA